MTQTINKLETLLATGGPPEYQSLRGKFHAHLTLEVPPEKLDECEQFCRQHKTKLTIIDLENGGGRKQTDVMLTCHFQDPEPNAVLRITDQLNQLANAAENAGHPVLRAKLEHESLPSLPTFDRSRYHEVHVKLSMDAQTYETDYARLKKLGTRHHFVPSRNPRQRREDVVTQFVNLRIYDGSHQEADERVRRTTELLEQEGFSITDVKRETVVFDTAQELDEWWA